MKAWISYSGLQRIETYPVPEAALREAVLNAVVHKDYASSVPVQISVYSDKLMIWNPGQLPANWTIAKLLAKHASEPFNPHVAGTFFRAGVIESWGRGVERIVAACRKEGRPDPQIEMDTTGVWVTFPYGEPPEAAVLNTTPETKNTTPETKNTTPETENTTPETENTTPETDEQLREKTSKRLLELLGKEPSIGRQALALQLGLSIDGVKYHLNRLRSKGIITHTGPSKSGAWHITNHTLPTNESKESIG
jgi:ATP-dependent DNA helicase RecG